MTISELSALVPEELESRLRKAKPEDRLMQTLLISQLHEISNEQHWYSEQARIDEGYCNDLEGRMHDFEGYSDLPAAFDIWCAESPRRSSAQMKAAMIVSNIIGQFIAFSLSDLRIIYKDHRNCYPPVHETNFWPEHLAELVNKIEEAATQDIPHPIFGETTAVDYAIANSQGASVNDIARLDSTHQEPTGRGCEDHGTEHCEVAIRCPAGADGKRVDRTRFRCQRGRIQVYGERGQG